ncbi:hypothetical protein SAMN05660464_3739 [Geodermatophilus dictyosporus]|uniref:Uncharacterized protein n=1 Tax=Geodermatophilus dictyosporus TaxID=1523247 RepID=A0A1I5RWT0_9ACTN|nr:hypothetical protein SAMN05660464_3739 [Geodermatophilus dictyosporus]
MLPLPHLDRRGHVDGAALVALDGALHGLAALHGVRSDLRHRARGSGTDLVTRPVAAHHQGLRRHQRRAADVVRADGADLLLDGGQRHVDAGDADRPAADGDRGGQRGDEDLLAGHLVEVGLDRHRPAGVPREQVVVAHPRDLVVEEGGHGDGAAVAVPVGDVAAARVGAGRTGEGPVGPVEGLRLERRPDPDQRGVGGDSRCCRASA